MFTSDDMARLVHARPFTAFRLHVSDGGQVDVLSSEAVLMTRRCAVIGLMDPDAMDTLADRWTVVWYMHVTRAEMLVSGAPPFSAPPGPAGEPSPTTA